MHDRIDAMGCNVSKDHQVDQQGSDGAAATKSAKSKGKRGSKKSTAEDANCVATSESTEHMKKGDGITRENGTADNDQKDMEIDSSDPSLNAAAAKIQASFRGHQVRKELRKTANEFDISSPKEEAAANDNAEDVDLSDPEVQKAATKIQASFRGYMVRKQVKDGNSPTSENPGS